MKRYRLLNFDFDSRPRILAMEIQDNWDVQVKQSWQENKLRVQQGLLQEFGPFLGERKMKDFIDLDAAPFSVVAFHNKFLRQSRTAFVIGAYYPALTAACALGERILNHLVLVLRDSFKSAPEYKKVYRKHSFDDWDLAINTLGAWNVLLPGVADKFQQLKQTRHSAIHFQPETDKNDRELALLALRQLSDIISSQFGALLPMPWFIPNDKGITFIRKSHETDPFVEKVYLPSCKLVGPEHQIDRREGEWIVTSDGEYEDREISDEKFISMFIDAQSKRD